MAQYTRTYRFAGQSNTSAARKVAWTKFAVSGDTEHEMKQIVGISFSHWHTSTSRPERTLRGRFVFADGTTLVSAGDTHKFDSNEIKFTNTFTSLPTPEQFAQITRLETINESNAIDQTGYSSSAKLYWRATNSQPMVVTVTFLDVPPTNYAPKVEEFIVGRCDANHVSDDTAPYIQTTLKLSLGDTAGLSDNPTVKIYYAENNRPANDNYKLLASVNITSRINDLLSGVTMDTTLLSGRWNTGSAWHFAAVFTCGDEVSAAAWDSVGNAFAPIAVSRQDGGKHVGIGGFPKHLNDTDSSFEVHSPAYFHGGIAGVGSSEGEPALAALGLQSGQTEHQTVAESKVTLVSVEFEKPYAAPPLVVAGIFSTSTSYYMGRCSCAVDNVTTTGFDVHFYNGGSNDRGLSATWIAVGVYA